MTAVNHDIKIFSGTANVSLAENICKYLKLPLGNSETSVFSDGEILVKITENVRGAEVFVIQSLCNPVNNHLMELLIMVDALRRSSASKITAVIPYFSYARQDRKTEPRVPITAKLVANLMTKAGIDRLITMDLHAGQIQGFFDIPVDNLFATPVFLNHFNGLLEEPVVVSPDAGGVERSRSFAKRLKASLAIIDKRRIKKNEAEIMNIIGDVENKDIIMLDDIIDTAGTLTKAAIALKNKGAKRIFAAGTHAILSGSAIEKINESPIEQMVITDTIPLPENKRSPKIKILSVADLLGEAIIRIYRNHSVSSLFV
ncbi:MAG: ribose-phosphate pyrophosphokinase [bacterium]|nr:ribose-phosphate pyrophosphokinase [bacterium]